MTRTHLKQIRESRGMAAAELARITGVARQTIYAIESGSFVPNTTVALQLARALDAPVEALFELETEAPADAGPVEADLVDDRVQPWDGQAVRLARVGKRLIAAPAFVHLSTLPEADGVVAVWRAAGSLTVRVPGGLAGLENTVVVAGCDPSIAVLARFLAAANGPRVMAVECSSLRALELLKAGRVHFAGMHLLDRETEEFNLPFIRRCFPRGGVRVVTYAGWEQGFVVAAGNPKGVKSAADLVRSNVRIMNREQGAGSRELLDHLLASAGVEARCVRGYQNTASGHVTAADSVRIGDADCCIANRATATALGLDFMPLTAERYDLVTLDGFANEEPVMTLLDVLNRSKLRGQLQVLAGYDTSQTGSVRA